MSLEHETATAAAVKTAPPLIMSGLVAYGAVLNVVLVIATIIYTLMNIYFLYRKIKKSHKETYDD